MKSILLTALALTLSLSMFSQDLKPFKAENGKMGYQDKNEHTVIEAKYNNAYYFSEEVETGWSDATLMFQWVIDIPIFGLRRNNIACDPATRSYTNTLSHINKRL